jgi:PAS domain S-box-containing protein
VSSDDRSANDAVELGHLGLNTLPIPVLVTRMADDTILYLNPTYTARYGFDSADIVGRSATELHHAAEDRATALRVLSRGLQGPVEVRLSNEAGECRWAEAYLSPTDSWGQPAVVTVFHDVGARREAEEELSRYAAEMEEIARFPEMNPGPVARLELDGTVWRANTAANRLFGQESLTGRSWFDLCPDIDEALWGRVLAGGDPVSHEVAVGDTGLVLTMAHDPASDQVFVYGTDVTEQKRAERQLAELARFPEMNPGPVARLGPDGTVRRANAAASEVFGCESLEGRGWRDLCPGIDDALWDRIVKGGAPIHHAVEVGDRYLDFTIAKDPGSDQIFVYGGDVTDLKKAEAKIAEMARFPDMNPGPVCRLDREACVVLANRAARELFDCEDLRGRSWIDLIDGVDEAFWKEILEADGWVPFEAKIGARQFVLTHAPGPHGEYVFAYGSDITDQKTAERALRQSEKMATLGTLAAGVAHELNNPAAAAQRASEQLSQVFGDFQEAQLELQSAPLGPDAQAFLQQLDNKAREMAACPCELGALARSDLEMNLEDWLEQRDVEGAWDLAPSLVNMGLVQQDLEETQRQVGKDSIGPVLRWLCSAYQVYGLLEEIRQGAGRLSEIVGALKAYSYLDQAPVQDVDVNEGLQNTLIILRSKLKGGIEVEQDLDPTLPRIEAFGSELNQVWTNLIDNAAYAMNGKGKLALRSFIKDRHVVVEIEDDGPGIPPDIQSRIYDAFFTTKPPGHGTGLGLNTTYNAVVRKHGGKLSLESVPGCTCFRVELPLERTKEA